MLCCFWLGGCQARPINRGLPCSSLTCLLLLSLAHPRPRPSCLEQDLLSSQPFNKMMAMGLLWVGLALLQALETQAQDSQQEIPVQPAFVEDKFVGTWYSVGLASTFPWFLKKKAELMMCKTVLTPEADGTVNFTATFVSNNQCETRTSLLKKTQQPGHYVYKSIKWGSEHNIFVVETNYEEYSLLYTTKTKGNSNFNMATLYSRTKDVRPELKERFIRFAKSHGFTEDTIVILPKTDQCIDEN